LENDYWENGERKEDDMGILIAVKARFHWGTGWGWCCQTVYDTQYKKQAYRAITG